MGMLGHVSQISNKKISIIYFAQLRHHQESTDLCGSQYFFPGSLYTSEGKGGDGVFPEITKLDEGVKVNAGAFISCLLTQSVIE